MSTITTSVSRGRSPITVSCDTTYYGKVLDMIKLDYFSKLRVVLFKCIWVDTTINKSIKVDEFGITNVNFSELIHMSALELDEPFILATDARMVYYVTIQLTKEDLDESLVEDTILSPANGESRRIFISARRH
ncbi:hypothetical protein AHAS_Ahas02G0151800 [Arachis hypogaea]